jgi:hypothetical protein
MASAGRADSDKPAVIDGDQESQSIRLSVRKSLYLGLHGICMAIRFNPEPNSPFYRYSLCDIRRPHQFPLTEGQKERDEWTIRTEKYAKSAAGYDQRIRNTFPFYEFIHPGMNAMLLGLVRPDSEVLVVGTGTGAEILESAKPTRVGGFWE